MTEEEQNKLNNKLKKAVDKIDKILYSDRERRVKAKLRDEQLEIIRKALLAGADANMLYLDAPILEHAAFMGDPLVVRYLLKAGADPNYDDEGYTPLLFAVMGWGENKLWVARELLIAGADVNGGREFGVDADGGSPLHKAVYYEKPELVQLLLDAGADVSVLSYGGLTPLHFAAMNDNCTIINMLLSAGADKRAKDDDGDTAADIAAQRGNKKALSLLKVKKGK